MAWWAGFVWWIGWVDRLGEVGLGLFGGLVVLTGGVRLVRLSGLVGWVCLVGGLG